MTTYTFRNGFEENTTNIYGIAFQCFLDYTVEIHHNHTWIPATDIEAITSLVPDIETKHPHHRDDGITILLYASNEIVAVLPLQAAALAIASAPEQEHHIQWSRQVAWNRWNSDRTVYDEVHKLLGSNCPPFIYDSSANAIDHNYWGLRGTGYPTKLHFWMQDYYQDIGTLIKADLREHGTCQVPYIGTFTLHGTRLSFSASRHLKDLLKGKPASQKRLDKGCDFGGESDPANSIPLWYHTKHNKLSKRRKFVLRMAQERQQHFQNVALANTAYQIFCNDVIDRLTNGRKFIWSGLGTLRPNNGRIHFRKSRLFSLPPKQ